MIISELKKADTKALQDINRLLEQLRVDPSEHKGTLAALSDIVQDKKSILLVAKDKKRIIAMATLYIVQKIGKRSGHVEDVVVDAAYRGQGLGEKIMRALIAVARKKKISALHLTSRPVRVAGNKLYQKLGFEQKETNVYRMSL